MVSYETVRRWVNHFGPFVAADLRKRRPKPHSTWHLDEAYIPIGRGFLYLVAVIDWASRAVLSWRLSNTMDASFCVAALEDAWPDTASRIFSTPIRAANSPARPSPAC